MNVSAVGVILAFALCLIVSAFLLIAVAATPATQPTDCPAVALVLGDDPSGCT